MRNHQKTFTMLLVLVLIGLNMRPLLTSVGPLLPQLRQASGMSFSVAALLTALPVVTMGGLALAGSWLHQHVSERRSVAISLLLIAVGALMRELYPQSALLLSSALLGGVGIGIIQAVMPSVIKRRFQHRTPLVMGLWSAALMGGGTGGMSLFTPMPTEGIKRLNQLYRQPTIENLKLMMDIFVFDTSDLTDALFEARLNNMLSRRDHLENFVKSLEANPKQFPDFGPRLAEIKAQTLIVWGRNDRFVPMDAGLRLLSGIAGSELHIFRDCGHWAQWEHADAFNQLVLNFLARP